MRNTQKERTKNKSQVSSNFNEKTRPQIRQDSSK